MTKASQNVGADTPTSDIAACQVVDPGVALHRGQHAKRQTDQQREQERDGGKLDRGRRVLCDVVEHRPLRGDRDAEIAVEDASEKDPVAIPQRQIEPPFVAERRDHVGLFAAMSPSWVSTGSPGTMLAIRKITRVASRTIRAAMTRREMT